MNTQASLPTSGTGPGTGHGAPPAPPGEHFFHRIRALGVVRPDEGRWAAGVCAGLARRWGIDPLLVRGLFVVVSIVTGFGLGLYGLLWMFLPHPDGRIHAQQLLRGVVTAGFVGSAIFLLIDLPLSNAWDRPGPFNPFGGLAFLALVGLGIWWLVTRDQRRPQQPGAPGTPGSGGYPTGYPTADVPGTGTAPTEPGAGAPAYGTPTPGATRPGGPESETSAYGAPSGYAQAGYAQAGYAQAGYSPAGSSGYAPPPPAGTMVAAAPRPVDVHKPLHALTLTTLGVALVAAGAVVGWDRYVGDLADEGFVATAVGLGVIALGIVLAGILGRRSGGLAPIAIVLAIVAANGAAWQDSMQRMDNDVTWAPVSASAASTGYNLGAGRAVLDLTGTGLTTGATAASPLTVPASLGAGELVVIVPDGVATQVDASVGLGAVTDRVDAHADTGGPGVSKTITSGPNPVLIVTAKVGLGHIEVVEQGTEVAR